MMVERFRRQGKTADWTLTEFSRPDATLDLESIGCAISLSQICARVELPTDDEDAEGR